MVRYFESTHRYKYNWEQVVRAFWCRYPNPCSEHVLSEDVIDRFIDSKGRLCTKRMLSKTNRVPKLASILIGESFNNLVYIIEESVLDPINKIFVTYTRNIQMQRLMTIHEKVTYRKSAENSQWTEEERKARIASNVFGSSKIEAFGVNRFKQNVNKTYKGFHMVLDAMFAKYSNSETNLEIISKLHPLLKERFKEGAKNLKEVAKSKAVPIVSAAANSISTNREEKH
ncbi:PRELI domain-containing protein 1-like protein [Dinothrombium tinctorium]|uniref:PRELI domain-containing protein 1-like protein n=1 Tax=Dinothrombium tinctorium TaxID=1965070 RepID=A0A3S3P9N1_9ACAR|nr:PRELI domain-containing protein 1-like protein [Dinothrombium tinctorium]